MTGITYYTSDLVSAQDAILHAEYSRYVTMVGFTILIWDHFCTFEEEVRLMWTAPRSLVKTLFFGNRYITPVFQAITVYQMSRLAVFSDTFCKRWTIINGYAEIISLAVSNLLLLFRLHALWGGRRSVVLSTLALYLLTYAAITVVATFSILELTPYLHYSTLARICSSDHRPKLMSALWTFALSFETVVFIMTAAKAFEYRRSEYHNPLLYILYRDQFAYYIVIMVCRVFNLVIWVTLPPSFLFLGLFFIWALITALVSRIMLHLRSVACASAHSRETFFGETAGSTRIAWARRTALESSFYAMSSADGQAADPMEGSMWNTGYEESGEPLQLRKFQTRKSRLWN